MSVISKAVFLSCAQEDADAAKQVAEALRTGGVEVWFDPSAPRGGDAWERKIKKQIKECALFVPVVSQHTHARSDGPFRIEWRHADQRTQVAGKSAAFVVPVCIDETRDEQAGAPDSFLEVQWTRLQKRPGQDAFDAVELSDLAQQVKNLIACGDIQFTPAPFDTASPIPTGTAPAGGQITPVRLGTPQAAVTASPGKSEGRVPAAVWIVAVVVVAAALGYFALVRK